VIFTLRSRTTRRQHQQQNRLHPYYLIYIGNDGRIISDHTEAKRLLDLARSACKGTASRCAKPTAVQSGHRRRAQHAGLLRACSTRPSAR
jgi:hypothetical protein